MTVSERLAAQLPYLRRYARALCGSQSSGDAYVVAMLEAAMADTALAESMAAGRVPLYTAFHRIWAATQATPAGASLSGSLAGQHQQNAQARLAKVTPGHRAALLLTTLEDFRHEEVGQIIGQSADQVAALVSQAIGEIDSELSQQVLIIEDEPLISMQLEELVTEMGHKVVGIATTRNEARDTFERTRPGLVLADIQLDDGSSGIDAVEDMLQLADVPVIFITAFPERLLTGQRPEPTYILTKPFQEATVRMAISQALFFGSTGPSA